MLTKKFAEKNINKLLNIFLYTILFLPIVTLISLLFIIKDTSCLNPSTIWKFIALFLFSLILIVTNTKFNLMKKFFIYTISGTLGIFFIFILSILGIIYNFKNNKSFRNELINQNNFTNTHENIFVDIVNKTCINDIDKNIAREYYIKSVENKDLNLYDYYNNTQDKLYILAYDIFPSSTLLNLYFNEKLDLKFIDKSPYISEKKLLKMGYKCNNSDKDFNDYIKSLKENMLKFEITINKNLNINDNNKIFIYETDNNYVAKGYLYFLIKSKDELTIDEFINNVKEDLFINYEIKKYE